MDFWEFALCVVAMVFLYKVVQLKCRRGGPRERSAESAGPVDDVQLIQDIQRGLARMEQRIEALETLLADEAEARKASPGEKRI